LPHYKRNSIFVIQNKNGEMQQVITLQKIRPDWLSMLIEWIQKGRKKKKCPDQENYFLIN